MSIKTYIEKKAEEAKVKADIFWWQSKEWAKQNPQQAEIIVATAIGATGVILKKIFSAAKIYSEKRLKDLYVYDRSLLRYWRLRRGMTVKEQIAFEQMKKSGMGVGEILTRLKLL